MTTYLCTRHHATRVALGLGLTVGVDAGDDPTGAHAQHIVERGLAGEGMMAMNERTYRRRI